MHIHIHKHRGRAVRDQQPGECPEARILAALEQYNDAKSAEHASAHRRQQPVHDDIAQHHANARTCARAALGHFAAGNAETAWCNASRQARRAGSALTRSGDLYD
jgi:hypothetical protein